MDRRTFFKFGLGGLAGATVIGGHRFLVPQPSRRLEPVDVLARRLFDGLDDVQRADACVGYEHPLRQYHNRGVWGGGRKVFSGFDRGQRQILTDLMHAGLSEEGRRRIPEEYFTRFAGVQSMQVLICGDPSSGPYQVILTGAHVNLRLGGRSREGAAFGGPQVYGDQRGDKAVGLPGNLYRDQFVLAQKLLLNMDSGRRRAASLDEAPVQTSIELRGRRRALPGIPVAELSSDSKALVRELVERILCVYPAPDVAYARECLAANGGLDALCVSYYGHDDGDSVPEAQVFRLEGPAAVFYFRGHPHVHAFLNIAMDGDAPLSVGETLGDNPEWLEGARVAALFEAALCSETGADLGFYPEDSVAGRLRPGTVRAGDIYSLESWQNATEVVTVRGSNLSPVLVKSLRARGLAPQPDKLYSVATTAYVAGEDSAQLGQLHARRQGKSTMLRDLTVAYLRSHGFPKTPA